MIHKKIGGVRAFLRYRGYQGCCTVFDELELQCNVVCRDELPPVWLAL